MTASEYYLETVKTRYSCLDVLTELKEKGLIGTVPDLEIELIDAFLFGSLADYCICVKRERMGQFELAMILNASRFIVQDYYEYFLLGKPWIAMEQAIAARDFAYIPQRFSWYIDLKLTFDSSTEPLRKVEI